MIKSEASVKTVLKEYRERSPVEIVQQVEELEKMSFGDKFALLFFMASNNMLLLIDCQNRLAEIEKRRGN